MLTLIYLVFFRNTERHLATRFDIYYNDTPLVYMLHKNHFYRFYGDVKSQEELIDFALGGFHDGEHKAKIPKLPSLMDEIFDIFNKEVEHRGGFLKTFFMLDR